MNRIKAFGAFWYDFVIGDDWHVAVLIVAGLGLTAILTHAAGVNAWWLLPLVAFAALGWSLLRATPPQVKVVDVTSTTLFGGRCHIDHVRYRERARTRPAATWTRRTRYAPRKRTGSGVSVAPSAPFCVTR